MLNNHQDVAIERIIGVKYFPSLHFGAMLNFWLSFFVKFAANRLKTLIIISTLISTLLFVLKRWYQHYYLKLLQTAKFMLAPWSLCKNNSDFWAKSAAPKAYLNWMSEMFLPKGECCSTDWAADHCLGFAYQSGVYQVLCLTEYHLILDPNKSSQVCEVWFKTWKLNKLK